MEFNFNEGKNRLSRGNIPIPWLIERSGRTGLVFQQHRLEVNRLSTKFVIKRKLGETVNNPRVLPKRSSDRKCRSFPEAGRAAR